MLTETMQGKQERLPIISPMLDVLKSRKVLLAITIVVVNVIITLVPEFEGMREELMVGVTVVLGYLIKGYKDEDLEFARAEAKKQAENPTVNLDESFKDVIGIMINEALYSEQEEEEQFEEIVE